MKRKLIILSVVTMLAGLGAVGCGSRGGDGASGKAGDSVAGWTASPQKVVEGLMHAYATRNDSLYAELLAGDFRYHFEPPGADSTEFLGWGKEEDLVATSNLFRTAEVDSLALDLRVQQPRAASAEKGKEWMVIPVAGGELRVHVQEKEPMVVVLNRQEIFVRRVPSGAERWEVIAWYDYPKPEN
jgi:hypothetical protein